MIVKPVHESSSNKLYHTESCFCVSLHSSWETVADTTVNISKEGYMPVTSKLKIQNLQCAVF